MGSQVDDVEAFCSKYGVTLQTKTQEAAGYEEGKVISQSRSAGSPIVKGTSLTVVIAKKPTEKPPTEKPSTDDKTNNNTDDKDTSNNNTGNNSTTTPNQN